MGFDDGCNTGLALRLGLGTATINNHQQMFMRSSSEATSFEPSLTLALNPADIYPPSAAARNSTSIDVNRSCEESGVADDKRHIILHRQASPPQSAVSSFSGGRVKKERDLSSEETRASDEEEDATVNARKKLRLAKEQSALLEESFKQHSTLNPKQKQALARQLNLRPRQVEVWFQNRRARTKLKQTEMDCEFMKKCCETLTDENRRLHKELQELKALKLAHPLYMHMPAATLTMCPSCERIGDGNSKGGPFPMAPNKPHCFNPVANPSAAC